MLGHAVGVARQRAMGMMLVHHVSRAIVATGRYDRAAMSANTRWRMPVQKAAVVGTGAPTIYLEGDVVLNDATLAPAVVWLLALALASLTVRRWAGPWSRSHPVLAIAATAAMARAVPIVVLDRGLPFDIEAHWWIGSLALARRDVYTDPLAHGRYPYPPFLHEYLSALLVWFSRGDRGHFLVFDKLAPALCGIAIAVVVRAIAGRLGRSPEQAVHLGLLYAVNPLPVLVTAYHGQFEEIPVLGIALALFLLLLSRLDRRVGVGAASLSALALGLAVAYKTWPLLVLPPLLMLIPRRDMRWERGGALIELVGSWALYSALTLTPLAITMSLYEQAVAHTSLLARVHQALTTTGTLTHRLAHDHMLYNVLQYKGAQGFCWGYVALAHACWLHSARARPHPGIVALNGDLLRIALVVVVLALLWRRRPLEGLAALPLAFYLFSPGWGPNYTIWVLPFLLVYEPALCARYTVVMLPLVALTYLDSLYAAFNHDNVSWMVLKPVEAALGVVAWLGVGVVLAQVYGAGRRRGDAPVPVIGHERSHAQEPMVQPVCR